MSYGLNGDSKQIIFALKSERDRLKERVAVLEMLVQSTSDDRDGYAERAAELERHIERVKELHQPAKEQSQGYLADGEYGYIETPCAGCEAWDEFAVPWPCATYRAATGEEVESAA